MCVKRDDDERTTELQSLEREGSALFKAERAENRKSVACEQHGMCVEKMNEKDGSTNWTLLRQTTQKTRERETEE